MNEKCGISGSMQDFAGNFVDKVYVCESACCIVVILSGTGSGIGTYILSLLKDEYPEIFRLAFTCEKFLTVHGLWCCQNVNIVAEINYSIFFFVISCFCI